MTDAAIQALIDAARTSPSDLVTWVELKAILEGLKSQVTLSDLSPSTNQIPKWNGTAWVADDDETATPGTPGDLDAVLTAGNTTDEGILFDETLTIPTTDGTAVTKIWFKFDNLAKTTESDPYQRVPFQISQKAVRQGGNAPTGKVNETMMFGWNLNPGGGNEIAGRPGIGISMESNFRDADQRLVEMHDFYITPSGSQIRLASYTCRTADFVLDFYHTVSRFYLKLPELANVQNEKQYFAVTPSNTTASISLGTDLGGRDGGIKAITLEANFAAGGGVSLSSAGLIQNEFFSQGFTHWNLPGLRTGQIGTSSNVKFLGTTSSVFDFDADKVFDMGVPSRRLNSAHIAQMQTQTKAGTPTTSDIPAGFWMVYKDTSGGSIRIWANDGGTMKSITLT
jgi:hypothetical protein